ncbi:eCIS core domain-containing protein [Granulicella arctica]|uniref:eCIS core domain-containing protein n=1 Tax=Granulicella arctica TaxID=940613 RepID=UPI0021DFBEAF|nr:DUF4157 domain-containing protein [Granulicella arctica]
MTGPGKPLPERERLTMQSKLGRDFSNVRVHMDSSAADAVGAQAFAYGRDVVFGPEQYRPGTRSGNELLAHELAHLGQQKDQGSPALQKQPKKLPGGLGSAPPAEAFQKASGAAIEDAGVVFELDKATLSKASQTALLEAVKGHKDPVTVQIDGYASSEGQGPDLADYNMNLSAHRAAAVKHFLEGKLPAESRVVLIAHGETTDFVPLEQNRRAGIYVRDGVEKPKTAKETEQSDAKKDDELKSQGGASIVGSNPTANLDLGLHYHLDAPYFPPLDPRFNKLSTDDMDWATLHAKAMEHGLRIDDRLADSLIAHRNYSYNLVLPVLGPKLSKSLADFGTSFALSNWLTAEYPNTYDKFNADFLRSYPDEKHIIIPILTNDTLDWMIKKFSHNK